MDRPATRPGTRPGPGSIPNFGGGGLANARPGGRPSTLPGRLPNRPGGGAIRDQVNPGQLGDFLGIQNVRPQAQRPAWQNLPPNRINNVNNNWNVAVGNRANSFQNWGTLHPNRMAYWNGWGAGVRRGWATTLPAYRPWFNGAWWARHPIRHGWWHYGYLNRPWRFWWTVPTWVGVTGWFAPWGWSQGNYYDYGTDGNVVYQDNRVLVDGQDVASADEFAQSAAELATVEPPADDAAAAAADWLPLGTFALSTSPDDQDLTRVLQLAVNKDGIVSGTLYNTKTEQSYTIQGRVDKDTQRVALMIVERPNVVLETGLFNLTQEEAPALLHTGADQTEQVLLVRLPEPEEDEKGDPAP